MGMCFGVGCLGKLATLAVTCTVNLPFVAPGGWSLVEVKPDKVCESVGENWVGSEWKNIPPDSVQDEYIVSCPDAHPVPDCSKGSAGYYDPCQICKERSPRGNCLCTGQPRVRDEYGKCLRLMRDEDGKMLICCCGDSNPSPPVGSCPDKCPASRARVRLEKRDAILPVDGTWENLSLAPLPACLSGEPLTIEVIP